MKQTGDIERVFNKYSAHYQKTFSSLDIYNDSYEFLSSLMTRDHQELLDIGCGPGNIAYYFKTKRADLRVTGIDVSAKMLKLASQNIPDGRFIKMNADEISSIDKKFDVITCGFCVPYLSGSECDKLIKDCSNLLHSDGLFYLSAIEGSPESSGFETSSDGTERLFINYHEERYLNNSFQQNKLSIIQTSRVNYTRNDGKESTHLIIIAQKLK